MLVGVQVRDVNCGKLGVKNGLKPRTLPEATLCDMDAVPRRVGSFSSK